MEKNNIDDLLTNEIYADDLSDISSISDGWDEIYSNNTDHDSDSLKTLDSDTEDEDDLLGWGEEDPPRNNEPFLGSPGATFDVTVGSEIITEKFIGDEFFQMVADETNKYYSQNSDKYESIENSKWVDVTVPEMKRWFGLVLLMSLSRIEYLHYYWMTNTMFSMPIVPKIISRKRFFEILQFLHFSDNSNAPVNAGRLHKVQKVVDYFTEKFKNLYKPSQNLSVVETLIPWKKRGTIKSYKPVWAWWQLCPTTV